MNEHLDRSADSYEPTVLFPEPNDPSVAAFRENYADKIDGARVVFEDMPLEEAARRIREDEVDIVIAGAAHDTPTVVRTAIHHINKVLEPEKRTTITSFFVMEKDGQDPLFFADCAVHDRPHPDEVVQIAENTAESVRHLGYEPVVAFLSLSSFGSAEHLEGVKQVQRAVEKFQAKHPDIVSYGEIQVDAATNADIFNKKAKGKVELKDDKMPNIFIFPDGTSGNLSYKWLQMAGYMAMGPKLDGVAKDWHDLSRGVKPEELLRDVALSVMLFKQRQQARDTKENPKA